MAEIARFLRGSAATKATNLSEPKIYAICALDEVPSRRAKGFELLRIDEEGREVPLSIVIVRWGKQVFGYINNCPHDNVRLDWERNQFLDPEGLRLMCGKHGAQFELGTGHCVEGPCRGEHLEPVAVCVIEDEICIVGVTLAEADDAPAA